MNTSFVDQLFDLLLSPVGLLTIVIGAGVVLQARRSRPVAWCLFSLCCFCASLAKFRDQFVSEPPALVFPLQQIRDFGRPLTIVLVGLLILLAFTKQASWRHRLLAQPVLFLMTVQIAIFLKTLYAGDIFFSFLSVATFAAVLLMMRYGPSRWLTDDKNFEYAVTSVALTGVIFICVNAYQAVFDIYPITFVHGRLLGTTGNPQHKAWNC